MSHTDSYEMFYSLLFPSAVHPYLPIIHSLDAWPHVEQRKVYSIYYMQYSNLT
jgi:hypothetical protein